MNNKDTDTNSILGFSSRSLRESVDRAVQQGKELENNINGVLKLQYPVFADKIDLAHSYGYTDEQIEPMLRQREQAALMFYSPDDINRVLKRTPQTIQQAAHIDNMFRVNALRKATGTSLNDDEISDRITASKFTGIPASVLISDNDVYEKVKPFDKMRRTLFDSMRIGLASVISSFKTPQSETEYLKWMTSLNDEQFKQAFLNGQIPNDYAYLAADFMRNDRQAILAEQLAKSQGYDSFIKDIADFISPEPSPDPDSMIHSLAEIAPSVAAGIAEVWSLGRLPGLSPMAVMTSLGAWRGSRDSNEQVFANRISMGDSVPEAYERAHNWTSSISGITHAVTSAAVSRLLGASVSPFGIVNPVMQKTGYVAGASIVSGVGAAASSTINDIRSGQDINSEKALQEGKNSAIWTGLFGMFSALFNGKNILNTQRDFYNLKKINTVLENWGYSSISENFSIQDSFSQIVHDLEFGSLSAKELIDLFKDLANVSGESGAAEIYAQNLSALFKSGFSPKDYGFDNNHAPNAIPDSFERVSSPQPQSTPQPDTIVMPSNETPPENNIVQPTEHEAIPMPPPEPSNQNVQSNWVFLPKSEWESYNQSVQNNDISPAAVINETGEVMLHIQDFQRLQNTAPDFVERIKDSIRDSANAVTKREKLISESTNQNEDNSLNWNSPRIKTLRKKLFQQWREAGYTRGQAKSISDMITDFAINYSYRTGIDPEDAVRISITNRDNIYPQNPPAENSNTVHSPVSPHLPVSENEIQQTPQEKNTDRIRTIRGTEVDVRYRILDADDLITSNNEIGGVNPDYPQDLQPRQRNRESSFEQIDKISRTLDPELLGKNRLASDGAPVIGSDLVVESGNGRVMGIRKAYKLGKAEHYRQWLKDNAAQFGLNPDDVDAVKNPVLVRERTSDVDRVLFTSEANESSVAQMSPSEHAFNDAKKISDSMLRGYVPDYPLESKYNYPFIRSFLSTLSTNERAIFLQSNGNISVLGLNRIRNALAAKAYGDASILNRLSEMPDDQIKNISNALYDAAARLASLENENIHSQLSLRNDIIQAVNTIARLKSEGSNIVQFLSQINIFNEDEISPEAKKLLEFFDKNKRSRKKIAKGLNRYAELAIQEAGNSVIFIPGLELSLKSKSTLLDEAIKFVDDNGQRTLFESYNQTKNFSFNPDFPDDIDALDPYTWPDTPQRKKALPLYNKLVKLTNQADKNPSDELQDKIDDIEVKLETLCEDIPEDAIYPPEPVPVHPFDEFYHSEEFKQLNSQFNKLVEDGVIDPKRITREAVSDEYSELDPYTWPDTPARLKALVIYPPLDKWLAKHDYDHDDMPPDIEAISNRIWQLSDESEDEASELEFSTLDVKEAKIPEADTHLDEWREKVRQIQERLQAEKSQTENNNTAETNNTTETSINPDVPDVQKQNENSSPAVPSVATIADFKKAFDELEHGMIYVSIPQLRKKLNWPHDVFDEMIYKLRDNYIIVPHVSDIGPYEPEEFFYDEDNERMGTITWASQLQRQDWGLPDIDDSIINSHAFDIPISQSTSMPDPSQFPEAAIAHIILNDKRHFLGNEVYLRFHEINQAARNAGIDDDTFLDIMQNMKDAGLITPAEADSGEKGIQFKDDPLGTLYSSFKINSKEAMRSLFERLDSTAIPDSYDDFSSGSVLSSNEAIEQNTVNSSSAVSSDNDYSQKKEEFLKAFDELVPVHGFVNIPELRKKLNWTHNEFDDMIRELRDNKVIRLHATDVTLFEPEEFFYDEDDNTRLGMVSLVNPKVSQNDKPVEYDFTVHHFDEKLPDKEQENELSRIETQFEELYNHVPRDNDAILRLNDDFVDLVLGLDWENRKLKRIAQLENIFWHFKTELFEHKNSLIANYDTLPLNDNYEQEHMHDSISAPVDEVSETSEIPAPVLDEDYYSPDYQENSAVLDDVPHQNEPDEADILPIKGRISWQKDIPAYEQTSIMELSRTLKDPTTVLHEIGHHMAKLLFDAVQFKGVDGEIQDDINAALNHAGVSYEDYINDNNGAKEKVHEDFADEFTKFTASGNAPNERLRRAFSRIRAWLIDLFRDLQRRNYKIDENMRRVFEHLFTSQERIDYASKIGELASEAAAIRELLIQSQNDLRSQIQNNAQKQKENEILQSQLDSANDELGRQQEQLQQTQTQLNDTQKQLVDSQSQIEQLQTDLTRERHTATSQAELAESRKQALDSSYDELAKQQELSAQNSQLWENTTEQAYIRGKNQGEAYGIQEGAEYQKLKDERILDRALTREHAEQSKLRDKKDAQIQRIREQKSDALFRLREKKNEQIERLKERYSDRLDSIADSYDERISKLKERLEQISKIKPAIQRNLKQIARMAKSKSISYDTQQEIEQLLSGFDLKKRSRDTLSHRKDVDTFLQAYPESAKQMNPDELRFAGTINISDMTLDDLRYLKWQVKVLYDKGRREFELWKAENRQRQADIRTRMFERIKRVNPPREQIITSREDIGKQYKGLKGKAQKIKDWNSAVLRTPDRVFDILDGGGAHYNGPWVENLVDIPREKINEAQRFINSRKDNMTQALAALGFKISDFAKTAAVIDGQKFSFDKIMEIFIGMRNPKKAKAIIFGNFVNPKGYSPDQAKDVISQLISHLSPEHMKAAELVIQDHNDNFQRINEALIRAFNKGMKQETDYSSMHRIISQRGNFSFVDPDDEGVVRSGLSNEQIMQRIETGFMLSRQNISDVNQQPLDLGLFANWLRDVSRHEFAAALGQTASDLMSVLLAKDDNGQNLMRMISDRFGNTMRKSVISFFNDTFTDNNRIADEFLHSVAGALSRNMSAAYIAYNAGVYVMQAMSYPLFLMSASPDYLLSSIAKFFRNPRAFLNNVYELSPTIKNMGRDPIDSRDKLLSNLNSSLWQKFINAGLEPTSLIDRVTKAIGWQATYDTNIRRGLSHEKAIREADRAVRLTQPPSNARDTMRITRNGSVAALKMKFTAALAAAWNMTTYDFIQKLFSKDWNNIKSAFLTFTGVALSAMLVKFMHDGGPDRDNEQSIPEWAAGAFSEQFINSIPLIGKDAMQSYNKHFRGKYGQSQFDAFNAPVDKILNAAGIISKENKSDDDYAKLGWLALEALSLTTGLSPYSGLKQTFRSLMMISDGEPLKGIANFLGFRQK